METINRRGQDSDSFQNTDGHPENLEELRARIVELEEQNQSLRKSEASFRALAENNLDVIMRFDAEYRLLYSNLQAKNQYGIPSKVFLGKTCRELRFLPLSLVELWEGALKRTFITGSVQRLEFQLPNGTWIDWLCMPELDENGNVKAVMTSARDISEAKRVAEELRESNASRAQFMDHAVLGMYRTSIEGRPLLMNPAQLKISGYSSMEEVVNEYEHLPHGDSEVNPAYSRARFRREIEEKGIVIGLESPWMKPNGETVLLRESAWIIRDSEGKPKYYEGIFEDITEQKKNEEQIRKLLAEKELILHEVHHRVKNNMATMMSLLSLQSQRAQSPEAAAVLTDAQGRLKSMAILYDKLYRLESVRALSLKQYLPSLLTDIISLYPNRSSIRTETQVDDFMLAVKLLSPLGIFVNEVVSNSMKHAFIGRDSGLISVSAKLDGGTVTIALKDDGIGLPDSARSGSSNGLGMQLIEMLAAQMEGTLCIERGRGTAYRLEFKT